MADTKVSDLTVGKALLLITGALLLTGIITWGWFKFVKPQLIAA